MLSVGRFKSSLEHDCPIAGVSPVAWRRFVDALEVQAVDVVSKSGGLGAYDIRPRRLVELGFAKDLRYLKSDGGRYLHECDFRGRWTRSRFLADPVAQYAALKQSILLYCKAFDEGKLTRPEGVSLAGALAILHRGGRGALESWPELFESTRELYESAREAF